MAENQGVEARPTRSVGERIFRVFLVVVFAAMVVELVLLVRQNREMKDQLSELLGISERQITGASLKDGEIVDPLALPSLDGKVTEVTYENPELDTLLLVFSPECPACEANMDNWKLLEQEYDSRCTRLFYISTADEESTRRFVEDHFVLAPVLIANQDDLVGYRVSHIPMTIVVGPDGVVERVWVGVMPEGAADELVNVCGV